VDSATVVAAPSGSARGVVRGALAAAEPHAPSTSTAATASDARCTIAATARGRARGGA
jgi:hypothetical protein